MRAEPKLHSNGELSIKIIAENDAERIFLRFFTDSKKAVYLSEFLYEHAGQGYSQISVNQHQPEVKPIKGRKK